MRPGPSARSSRDARLTCSRSRLLRRASVSVAAISYCCLPRTMADFAAPIRRCRFLDIPLHPISSEQRSSWNNVPLSTWGQRKAPGRLSPGPAVPLLTRGLIRDRHAKHAHRIGHFWAWRLRGVHICSLLSHRYSQARVAACISNPHSVSRSRAHAGDGARSLLISISAGTNRTISGSLA